MESTDSENKKKRTSVNILGYKIPRMVIILLIFVLIALYAHRNVHLYKLLKKKPVQTVQLGGGAIHVSAQSASDNIKELFA